MTKFLQIAILISVLILAGCCCSNAPEPLPAGAVPLTNGYGPVVTPQPVPVAAPAPKTVAAKKRVYKKKRTAVRKAAPKKVVKKAPAKRRTVRRTVRPAAAPRQQAVPPIPVPLDEVREAGRVPERLQ